VRLSREVGVCLLAGTLGMLLLPFGRAVEEDIGLKALFKLRGPGRAPSNVAIVAIDKASADYFGLPEKPEKWPRTFHARLTDALVEKGAAVIVFDMFFQERQREEDALLFAESIRKAGNVILSAWIKQESLPLADRSGKEHGEASIEELVSPIPPLAESAKAVAPFPLPRVPLKVSQYWAFKTCAGDLPTLPVVAFQLYARHVHGELVSLLKKADARRTRNIRPPLEGGLAATALAPFISELRNLCVTSPDVANQALQELDYRGPPNLDPREKGLMRSLLRMYQGPETRYLNFYGPPRTFETISYKRFFPPENLSGPAESLPSLKDKVVFVGISEYLQPERKDTFPTVFSQESGDDLSGVEIAATAFANLQEDNPVTPIGLAASLGSVFVWGVVLALICLYWSTLRAMAGIVVLSALFLLYASYQFSHSDKWYPLVIPLLVQAPVAIYAGIFWRYLHTSRKHDAIKKSIGYYLPPAVVEDLTRSLGDIKTSGQILYGTCLSTDAEHYTDLSETLPPKELRSFMNEYYEVVFEPIKRHGGFVSDIIGDSMLALWISAQPDARMRHNACLAAMDIANRIRGFAETHGIPTLPTRIGIHAGEMSVGNVGAIDHYEYRAVGDAVNTVSRIERLNKYLGTWVLISREALEGVEGLLTREMGSFVLPGKKHPVEIYELLGCTETADQKQVELCTVFSAGLADFKNQSWEKASRRFSECLQLSGDDSPSKFYLDLCSRHQESPPEADWNGSVNLNSK
jgi:adenylate cyclase